MKGALGLVLALASIVSVGCGRSSPDLACPAREGLACAELAKARADEQGVYTAAATSGDAVTAGAVGTCNQTLVNEQVERRCIADPCVDLCALQPCTLKSAGTCEDNCRSLGLNNAALDVAAVRAAETPGLCTCAVCDDNDGTAPLCTDLWACR